jgi:hypothetical protein
MRAVSFNATSTFPRTQHEDDLLHNRRDQTKDTADAIDGTRARHLPLTIADFHNLISACGANTSVRLEVFLRQRRWNAAALGIVS